MKKQLFLTAACLLLFAVLSCNRKDELVPGPGSQETDPDTLADHALPLDSRLVYIGDSQTAHQFNNISGSYYYLGEGFATHANIAAGSRYYQPIGGNKGVSGESSSQILARMGAVMDLKPDVAVVLAGANDESQNFSAELTKSNLTKIYSMLRSINCKVVAITIPNRFPPAIPLSPAQEAIRLDVNEWIKKNPLLSGIVDAEPILSRGALFEDGLHPNTQGDYLLGTAVGNILGKMISTESAGFQIHPESVSNYSLAGGTTIATNWSLNSSMGGGIVTGSKTNDNGLHQQVLTLSGNYTGDQRGFRLLNDFPTSYYKEGDVIEGIVDFEIVTPLQNVIGISPNIGVYTERWSTSLALTTGYFPDWLAEFPYGVGRYVIKTPPIKIGVGTPAIIQTGFEVYLRYGASNAPVAGQIKIHRIGSRRIP